MYSKIFDNRKGKHIWPQRTICEVHREIYDLLVVGKHDAILEKLEEAYVMGIKLCRKLTEYKCELPEWKNNDSQESRDLRELRIQLTKDVDEISNHI